MINHVYVHRDAIVSVFNTTRKYAVMSTPQGTPETETQLISIDKILITNKCRNMPSHALMGRPAARLETMVLVISSYVLVCIVGKRR